jgi:hypothetical protein
VRKTVKDGNGENGQRQQATLRRRGSEARTGTNLKNYVWSSRPRPCYDLVTRKTAGKSGEIVVSRGNHRRMSEMEGNHRLSTSVLTDVDRGCALCKILKVMFRPRGRDYAVIWSRGKQPKIAGKTPFHEETTGGGRKWREINAD